MSTKIKRRCILLSRFISSIIVTLIFSVTILAVLVQGVTPDVVGPDGLPDGYIGFFADNYWNISRCYIQSANDSWNPVPVSWSNGSLFYEDVSTNISDTVNTFPMYAVLDTYRTGTWNAQLSNTVYYQTTHIKYILPQVYTIPAGQQMEFWVRVNRFRLTGYPQTSITGTNTSGGLQTYSAAVFEYCLDDRWYKGDQDVSSYVVFDHYTSLINNDWVCYRSDTANIDRTISGIAFVPPVGEWAFLYQCGINFSIDFSPVIVGDLNSYGQEPDIPTSDVVGKLDDIINGTPDMDPDVSTPNYDDIRPDPDYDVGGIVGESDAISGLDQMQQDVDLLIGSENFVTASNFWQELFNKLFSIAGSSVMASVSGVIIVIRAVIGR